jgi:inosine-uridine nucleoside N-ribohydrolase
MARKVILITDPGIDSAFAVALALLGEELEVVGLAATAGNVVAEQATRNVQILVEQIDPPRWPRLGEALPISYAQHAQDLHGPKGLGGVDFPVAQLHHLPASDKLVSDLVRLYPKEVSIVVMGPATVLARALDREPDLRNMVERVILVGGVWHEAGDAGPSVEFHFSCDPQAARQVLQSGLPVTLLPLDVTRQLIFSPSDLLQLPADRSRAGAILRQIIPHGIRASSSLFGTEGFYLLDVLGVVALAQPSLVQTQPIVCDVETRGELTRGMTVFDTRWGTAAKPNIDISTQVDVAAVRRYIGRILYQNDDKGE